MEEGSTNTKASERPARFILTLERFPHVFVAILIGLMLFVAYWALGKPEWIQGLIITDCGLIFGFLKVGGATGAPRERGEL
jgi:hypothetical protein